MSTTFEVYTSTKNIPSLSNTLLLSNKYLSDKLKSHDIDGNYLIDVSIRCIKTHSLIPFNKTSPAIWSTDCEYAWFTINNQPGGCDAYISKSNDYYRLEAWNDEFVSNERAATIQAQMMKCFETGFYWTFRRSVGQLAIINLAYGLIAAAFAELTKGFIFSDDGGWDYAMFPTTASHFLQNYFNLQYPKTENANWAKECIDILKYE